MDDYVLLRSLRSPHGSVWTPAYSELASIDNPWGGRTLQLLDCLRRKRKCFVLVNAPVWCIAVYGAINKQTKKTWDKTPALSLPYWFFACISRRNLDELQGIEWTRPLLETYDRCGPIDLSFSLSKMITVFGCFLGHPRLSTLECSGALQHEAGVALSAPRGQTFWELYAPTPSTYEVPVWDDHSISSQKLDYLRTKVGEVITLPLK